jgi:geranylgeranylglyceryl phosphate synthase family protein
MGYRPLGELLLAKSPIDEAWGVKMNTTLRLLQERRGSLLHIVDPYKVHIDEAVDKAKRLEKMGFPAILVGGTDYDQFNNIMTPYISHLRSVTRLPLILHFPPRDNTGVPFVTGVDAMIWPAVLNSRNPHYVWKGLLQTSRDFGRLEADGSTPPEPIFSAALTFGDDRKSEQYMGTIAVPRHTADIEKYCAIATMLGVDIVYLYSRHEAVSSEVCKIVRRQMSPDTLIFVGGGIRCRADAESYLCSGADYTVFGGALETSDWELRLAQFGAM